MSQAASASLGDEELLRLSCTDVNAFEALNRRSVGKTVAFAIRRCRPPEEVHGLVVAI